MIRLITGYELLRTKLGMVGEDDDAQAVDDLAGLQSFSGLA